jgi:hypothetical protein
MHNVLKMGKKAMTVSVVVATIAWSIGFAALVMPMAAGAASLTSGDLIKASQPAVYYYGADGKRYVFPNEKTYKTWYSDFSSVKIITDTELAAISIGGNVTYKPAAKMVKITTDPKVYAVAAMGTLRWVNSEQVAANLYGSNWNTQVDDVSDAFFVNYKVGADIASTADFDKAAVTAAAVSINVDKGLASSSTGGTGTLAIAADSSNMPSGSIVADATDGGQRRAPLLKVNLSAGSSAVTVTGLKFKRGGISKDGDVDNLFVMDGKIVSAESISLSSGVATFNNLTISVPANSSKVITLAVDINKDIATGSTMNWSLASADVTSNAATVSGSAIGNTMTSVTVTDLGSLKIGGTNTAPASVDPGVTAKEMWRLSFEAQSQDMLLTYVKFNNLGSVADSDIQNIKLMDGATQLDGVIAQSVDKVITFDLSTMTGGGYKILAGQSKQLTLVGDIIGGTNRTFRWSIQRAYDVHATDLTYNVEAYANNGTAATFGTINAGSAATDINTGNLTVSVATDSPSTNVADASTGVTLAKFNYKATGEDVKVTDLTVICVASTATRALKNTKVLLDGVQVGSTDTSAVCAGATTVATYTFGNSFIVKAGVTSVVSIVADLNATVTAENWVADDTVYVGFGGTAVAQGKTSLTSITPTNVNGRTLTVKTGALSVLKDQSFSDRGTNFPTGVSNASGVKVGSFVIVGGAGENALVSQIVVRDDATNQLGDDYQNLVLKDRDGNQVGTTISALNTAEGTYTFTPATSILVSGQKAFDLFADVLGAPANSGAVNGPEIDTVAATGASTGASANFGTAGDDATDVALQLGFLATNGNLTIDEASDTPTAQQMVLGATGVELAKFKLSASAAEDINVTQFVVADDMTNGGASRRSAATGSLKNLKLYNGSTLLASVATLDATANTTTPYAAFAGFSLVVPKNSNLTLTVKADLTSYDDGGMPSSVHRIILPVDGSTAATGVQDSVVALGAGSGYSISSTSLDLNGAAVTGNTDADVAGGYMSLVRAKLTLAHASDAPSGASSAASEHTVAKFVATNGANVGNYSATIKLLNIAASASGNSVTAASAALTIYKDAIGTANQLATTTYCPILTNGCNYAVSTITEGNFTDMDVAAGSSKTIVVTLNTSSGGFSSADTLTVGVNANQVRWNDGNVNGDDYYSVDTLPLVGKTLVF